MFKDLKKHGEFDFFAENRLVFKQPQGGGGGPKEAKKGPKPLSGQKKIWDKLDALTKNSGGETFNGKPIDPKAPKSQDTPTHTEDRHTRTVTVPTPEYKESADIAQKRVKLSGKMDAKETAKMQGVHTNLYRQYINPGFMMHLRMSPKLAKKVFPFLNMVMEQPTQFEYRSKSGNVLHIVRRKPYVQAKNKAKIPADFLVVMEGKNGSISKVNKTDLMVNGKFPWISNEKFRKDIPIYQERWRNEFRSNKWGEEYRKFQKAGWTGEKWREEWRKLIKRSLKNVPGPIKDIHKTMNVEFPKRLVGLIKSRNFDFEMKDPQVKDLFKHQAKQWTNYDNRIEPDRNRIMVLPDPEIKGAYQIITRGYAYNPMRVDSDGYILRPPKDGSWNWHRDPRYDEWVRREYYKDNPKAKVDLDNYPADKKRMEETNKKDTPTSSTAKHMEKLHKFIEKREAVDKAVDAEVKKGPAGTPKLREVAIAVQDPNKTPAFNARRAANINRSSNNKLLQQEIKEQLDKDLGKVDAAGNMEETRNNIAIGLLPGVIFAP